MTTYSVYVAEESDGDVAVQQTAAEEADDSASEQSSHDEDDHRQVDDNVLDNISDKSPGLSAQMVKIISTSLVESFIVQHGCVSRQCWAIPTPRRHDEYRKKVSRYAVVSCTAGSMRSAWGLGGLNPPKVFVLTAGCPL